jgi:hypothetical protein
MNKIILSSLMLCAGINFETSFAKTVTFYCPPISAINVAPNDDYWAPYQYSSPNAVIANKQGLQLAQSGKGESAKVLQFKSAVWSDRELLCNYDGLTDSSTPDMIVMFSRTLGPSPSCHFAEGSECLADSPDACPMTCNFPN